MNGSTRTIGLVAIGLAMVVGVSEARAGSNVEVSKYGKVLTPAKLGGGSNIQSSDAPALRVEMVQVKNTEDYVLKFTGVEHENDGKVLRYTRAPAGADAWFYARGGRNIMREEKSNYSPVTVYTLYANNKEYKLVVDAEETKKLDVGKLVKELK